MVISLKYHVPRGAISCSKKSPRNGILTNHFVNLSKGHICSCGFETINDAILDMEHYKNNGMIDDYYCILGE